MTELFCKKNLPFFSLLWFPNFFASILLYVAAEKNVNHELPGRSIALVQSRGAFAFSFVHGLTLTGKHRFQDQLDVDEKSRSADFIGFEFQDSNSGP